VLNKKPQYKLDIELDIMRLYDVPEVSRLYEEAFSEHFLGHMGRGFLELFCAEFSNSPTNYGFVARNNGRPVGFVFGSIDTDPFNHFYKNNFWRLVVLVAERYLKDDYVRKHIMKRSKCFLAALKSFMHLKDREGEFPVEQNLFAAARILAIGVDSNYRGMGIANQLTNHFCTKMKQEGFKKVGLSTLAWNKRAIHFYKKDGWILEKGNDSSLSFIRTII
jgi:ribosomal protein S18 acetylase RimI-like enzyme